MPVALQEIVSFLNDTLRIGSIKDDPRAMNGLQVENDGLVNRVAAAVDGSSKTIEAAIEAGADLLLLHHGIFWSGMTPVAGWWKKKLEMLLHGGLAVYSAHLPLDLHPTLGNNALIAKYLSLEDIAPEIHCHGEPIGCAGFFPGTLGELKAEFSRILKGSVGGVMSDAPDTPAGRVAVCSGAGAGEIYQIHAKGYRTYLTGEVCHWAFGTAEDMGMNLFFGGHYGTETFGVRELGRLLEERFGLPWVFIHHPTGA